MDAVEADTQILVAAVAALAAAGLAIKFPLPAAVVAMRFHHVGHLPAVWPSAWWGTVPAVVFGGAVTVLVALSFAYIFPQLRQVNSLDSDDLVRKYRDPPAVSNN